MSVNPFRGQIFQLINGSELKLVHSRPMDDVELEIKILQLLSDSPGLTACELESLTGVFKGKK